LVTSICMIQAHTECILKFYKTLINSNNIQGIVVATTALRCDGKLSLFGLLCIFDDVIETNVAVIHMPMTIGVWLTAVGRALTDTR